VFLSSCVYMTLCLVLFLLRSYVCSAMFLSTGATKCLLGEGCCGGPYCGGSKDSWRVIELLRTLTGRCFEKTWRARAFRAFVTVFFVRWFTWVIYKWLKGDPLVGVKTCPSCQQLYKCCHAGSCDCGVCTRHPTLESLETVLPGTIGFATDLLALGFGDLTFAIPVYETISTVLREPGSTYRCLLAAIKELKSSFHNKDRWFENVGKIAAFAVVLWVLRYAYRRSAKAVVRPTKRTDRFSGSKPNPPPRGAMGDDEDPGSTKGWLETLSSYFTRAAPSAAPPPPIYAVSEHQEIPKAKRNLYMSAGFAPFPDDEKCHISDPDDDPAPAHMVPESFSVSPCLGKGLSEKVDTPQFQQVVLHFNDFRSYLIDNYDNVPNFTPSTIPDEWIIIYDDFVTESRGKNKGGRGSKKSNPAYWAANTAGQRARAKYGARWADYNEDERQNLIDQEQIAHIAKNDGAIMSDLRDYISTRLHGGDSLSLRSDKLNLEPYMTELGQMSIRDLKHLNKVLDGKESSRPWESVTSEFKEAAVIQPGLSTERLRKGIVRCLDEEGKLVYHATAIGTYLVMPQHDVERVHNVEFGGSIYPLPKPAQGRPANIRMKPTISGLLSLRKSELADGCGDRGGFISLQNAAEVNYFVPKRDGERVYGKYNSLPGDCGLPLYAWENGEWRVIAIHEGNISGQGENFGLVPNLVGPPN